jgi:hypothetical protein
VLGCCIDYSNDDPGLHHAIVIARIVTHLGDTRVTSCLDLDVA